MAESDPSASELRRLREEAREKRRGQFTEYWAGKAEAAEAAGPEADAAPSVADLQARCAELEASLKRRDEMMASVEAREQATIRTAAEELDRLREALARAEAELEALRVRPPSVPAVPPPPPPAGDREAARQAWVDAVLKALARP